MKRARKRFPAVYAQESGARVHVVTGGSEYGPTGACGAVLGGPEYLAHMVPVEARCRTRACQRRFPPFLQAIAGGGG